MNIQITENEKGEVESCMSSPGRGVQHQVTPTYFNFNSIHSLFNCIKIEQSCRHIGLLGRLQDISVLCPNGHLGLGVGHLSLR